jgi:hypothetical protein
LVQRSASIWRSSLPDLLIGARAHLLRDQVARPIAHALLYIVARDDQVLAVVAHAAHDQMDMRMLGVPMTDRHPFEPRAEILLHLAHQLAGEALEVGHFQRVVRRDDEAEMVAVVLGTLGEILGVDVIAARTEQPGLLPVTGDAIAAQIIEMRRERRGAATMSDDPRLDHRAA